MLTFIYYYNFLKILSFLLSSESTIGAEINKLFRIKKKNRMCDLVQINNPCSVILLAVYEEATYLNGSFKSSIIDGEMNK